MNNVSRTTKEIILSTIETLNGLIRMTDVQMVIKKTRITDDIISSRMYMRTLSYLHTVQDCFVISQNTPVPRSELTGINPYQNAA